MHWPVRSGYGQQIVAKASSETEALLSQILNKLRTEGRAVVRGAGAKACAASAQALVAARQALAEQGYELAVLPRWVGVAPAVWPAGRLTVWVSALSSANHVICIYGYGN